ncbi:hypothetical protein [Dyadobacter fermentans]|uniref:hypothetical protein n=1 Tax=Dyadobacter fermentans TaxID=94254 RepID=UPI001CBF0A3E|nr:hypothetical protein [Dyadobacter fermentans]MBZ1360983.1 hypothetical protein [Dyadobacter fermentans]
MVHLEERYLYINRLKESQVLKPLVTEILSDGVIETLTESYEANSVALNLLIFVKNEDRVSAMTLYDVFSKRRPTKETHWVYDDFVLFALVCTVRKFSLSTEWLKGVLELTITTGSNIDKTVRHTFNNLLSGNLLGNDDFYQISIVCQKLTGQLFVDNLKVDTMLKDLWTKNFPFFESDFLNVISLKAIEIAFESKGILSPIEFFEGVKFSGFFRERVDSVANGISWSVVTLLCAITYCFLFKINLIEDKLINQLFNFSVSVLGIGLLGIFKIQKPMKEKIRKIIYRFWRYTP